MVKSAQSQALTLCLAHGHIVIPGEHGDKAKKKTAFAVAPGEQALPQIVFLPRRKHQPAGIYTGRPYLKGAHSEQNILNKANKGQIFFGKKLYFLPVAG
ncbi:MAG: hypothetical protein ACYS76_11915 [Planctomycetota bacterium]|jgi:hypothetical protein